MGRSRYPRRNHRLAPATLRELLQDPVPAKYLATGQATGLRLCDLDETAWDRFGDAVCRQLAGEVLRTVGRAARMPMAIADRRPPPLPQGIHLTDLDLEVRTFNCLVSAGIHERPQDLRAMTIEGMLGLRGFWVKCLLDLLTSLEYVVDHPEVRKSLRRQSAAVVAAPRIAGCYPRPGYRLAPRTLEDILAVPVPGELVDGSPLAGRRLCDLDESVWKHLSPETIDALADQIVSRVNISGYNRAMQRRALPTLPPGIRLEDLRLENRTYNCLRRQGFGRRPEDLAKRTVGQLLSIKAFGAKCLVDLLTSLEALASRAGNLDERLSTEVTALAKMPEAAQIRFNDPRLGALLRGTDNDANTVAELVAHVLKRQLDPPDPLRLVEQVIEVRRRVEELSRLALEEELLQIVSPASAGRDREIIAGYFGWDGNGGGTLEAMGKKYGLSRERIRQVCMRAVKRNRRARVFAPVLDRVLAFVAARIPVEAGQLQAEVDAAGFSTHRLSLEIIGEAAGFLSRQPTFAIAAVGDARLAVRPDCTPLPRAIVQIVRRAILSYGATTIQDVAAELAAQYPGKGDHVLITATVRTLKDFRWLDEQRGWFRLAALPQYGLPNMIEKVLSVAGRVDVGRLRAAIMRYRRTARNVPPPNVLLEFCRHLPGLRVEGKTVVADPLRDWREVLGGVEAGLVRVLKEHGPVMDRSELEDLCAAQGINRFSFNALIMCSPVIAQYGRSVYGLIGVKVDRKTLRALTARKTPAVPGKVLRRYGQTADGQIYLLYRLSKAAISGGVITVPAALKEHVQGPFAICTPAGQQAGTLVSKNGCAWGLGPVLRANGARPGDHLTIQFALDKRMAVVSIGDPQSPESAANDREPRSS